jgi:hypothetical protein
MMARGSKAPPTEPTGETWVSRRDQGLQGIPRAVLGRPGYQTFGADDERNPHLVEEAIREARRRRDLGEPIPDHLRLTLYELCEILDSRHGTKYGSDRWVWEKLGIPRSTWYEHRKALLRLGLVVRLPRLGGFRTRALQVLPHLYALVSDPPDPSVRPTGLRQSGPPDPISHIEISEEDPTTYVAPTSSSQPDPLVDDVIEEKGKSTEEEASMR